MNLKIIITKRLPAFKCCNFVTISLLEEFTSILITDLSGYTAVTEAHGAGMAADIIDQYIKIIKDSLGGCTFA